MTEEKLASFLKNGNDWARMKTNLPGVFILKLPSYRKSPPRLAVELNPPDKSGNPKKKRGLILRSSQELEEFSRIFQIEKLSSLLKTMDKVNPQTKAEIGEEVLEI